MPLPFPYMRPMAANYLSSAGPATPLLVHSLKKQQTDWQHLLFKREDEIIASRVRELSQPTHFDKSVNTTLKLYNISTCSQIEVGKSVWKMCDMCSSGLARKDEIKSKTATEMTSMIMRALYGDAPKKEMPWKDAGSISQCQQQLITKQKCNCTTTFFLGRSR